MVEVLTDNRNRTGADIRSIFSKNGGSIAEPGSVPGSSTARATSWWAGRPTRRT